MCPPAARQFRRCRIFRDHWLINPLTGVDVMVNASVAVQLSFIYSALSQTRIHTFGSTTNDSRYPWIDLCRDVFSRFSSKSSCSLLSSSHHFPGLRSSTLRSSQKLLFGQFPFFESSPQFLPSTTINMMCSIA